jgi:hypothetical protein
MIIYSLGQLNILSLRCASGVDQVNILLGSVNLIIFLRSLPFRVLVTSGLRETRFYLLITLFLFACIAERRSHGRWRRNIAENYVAKICSFSLVTANLSR